MSGLLEIVVFFIVIYFIMSVLRLAYRNFRSVNSRGAHRVGRRKGNDDKVIELDKDQYHVE